MPRRGELLLSNEKLPQSQSVENLMRGAQCTHFVSRREQKIIRKASQIIVPHILFPSTVRYKLINNKVDSDAGRQSLQLYSNRII